MSLLDQLYLKTVMITNGIVFTLIHWYNPYILYLTDDSYSVFLANFKMFFEVEITFLFKVHVQGSLQVIGNCSLIFK